MANRLKRATFATQLLLIDVKSFAGEQILDLTDKKGNPARWTLLLGDNGVGKTTLLECLTQLTPTFNSGSGAGEKEPRLFVEPRIARAENPAIFSLRRLGAQHCLAQATFAAASMLNRDPGTEQVQTWVSFDYHGDKEQNLQYLRWPSNEDDDVPESKWASFSALEEPLAFAYSAGRHMGIGNLDLDDAPDSTASLLEQDAELFDVEELLLRLHHASLTKRATKAKRQKELLIATIAELLPEVGSPDDIIVQAATAIGDSRKQGVFVRTCDGEVPLKQLSFGYQTMMAWIGDIAWRLFAEHPDSSNPLHEPAIVVVDEIDLHLHPNWQRQLRDLLTRNFPNVQFIATAHSPLMAQAFLDANLAVVMREGDHSIIENDPVAIKNWSVDQIVTSDLFNLPSPWPPQVDALFQEQARLLAKDSLSVDERKRLRAIERDVLALPTEESPIDETALRIVREAARDLTREPSSK